MDTKVCNNCKIEKPLSEFHRDKYTRDGYTTICKKCRNTQGKEYKKTLQGLLKTIYRHQHETSEKRGHPPPTYTFEELCQWFVLQPNWEDLYYKWQASGYDRKLIPSVDRIDDSKGYSLNNIQLITAYENIMKQVNKLKIKVNQYDLNGNYIKTWESMSEAYIKLGIGTTNIKKACEGKYRYAGGYQWRYTNDYPPYKNIEPIKKRTKEGVKLLCIFPNNEQKVFNSIYECALYFNTSHTPILNKLNGRSVKNELLQKVVLKELKEK